MKLIIDIDDIIYKYAVNSKVLFDEYVSEVAIAIISGTPLDSIIADIEAARDKDKLCEYPYNRCIDILRRTGE